MMPDVTALRLALQQGELRLYYQPSVDLRSGVVNGVEALLRWERPGREIRLPSTFISLAEESGLIVSLGVWVLRTACEQAKAWQRNSLSGLTVAVNVSPWQFQEGHLHETVARILGETGLAPEGLELEITESIAMAREEHAIASLKALKAMGVNLSIDDFGTGYSSLAQLQCCPVSKLKIDSSFVGNLARNTPDKAIVQAIVFLGHSLDMRVTAEGVETEQQLELLRGYGCDEIQGFLVSPAVRAEMVPGELKRWGIKAASEREPCPRDR
ncbi:putative bifunctional diguanylate cyclase/phosphodiesterase [Pelomicrobium sp. G1]|uniref:putative bifunctional diguanylate cyclase/phosphodiesterase n=1 Tax=unclassified Pelomicrobium TaxID=2815318 RepID=UPI003F777A2C